MDDVSAPPNGAVDPCAVFDEGADVATLTAAGPDEAGAEPASASGAELSATAARLTSRMQAPPPRARVTAMTTMTMTRVFDDLGGLGGDG